MIITHGDLFSGIGAFKSAFEYSNISHKTLYCSEIDKFAYTSYKAIHGSIPNFGDISKININDIPYTDLITYGFPCQDISTNGLQRGIIQGETRSGLLYEALHIIKTKKPKYAIAENVKNLISKKFIGNFEKTLQQLDDMGYVNVWGVLNAKDFGLPQNRERVFIVSIRKDIYHKYHKNFNFKIIKNISNKILENFLEKNVDYKYYILLNKCPIYLGKVNEQLKIQEAVKKGYSFANPYDSINLEHPRSKTRRGRIGKQLVQTLTCSCNQAVYIPNLNNNYIIRKLTPLECWRLQGFKDEDFHKARQALITTYYNGRDRADSQLYKQAGNSIAVNCLMAIYKEVFDFYRKI